MIGILNEEQRTLSIPTNHIAATSISEKEVRFLLISLHLLKKLASILSKYRQTWKASIAACTKVVT